jgi:hypothetical protein
MPVCWAYLLSKNAQLERLVRKIEFILLSSSSLKRVYHLKIIQLALIIRNETRTLIFVFCELPDLLHSETTTPHTTTHGTRDKKILPSHPNRSIIRLAAEALYFWKRSACCYCCCYSRRPTIGTLVKSAAVIQGPLNLFSSVTCSPRHSFLDGIPVVLDVSEDCVGDIVAATGAGASRRG